ncbi:hypothetical protein AMTR_s00085p00090290, partial [Amborella trichopoda]
ASFLQLMSVIYFGIKGTTYLLGVGSACLQKHSGWGGSSWLVDGCGFVWVLLEIIFDLGVITGSVPGSSHATGIEALPAVNCSSIFHQGFSSYVVVEGDSVTAI